MSTIRVAEEITIRAISVDDANNFFEWLEANPAYLAEWLEWATSLHSLDDVQAQLAEWTSPEQINSRIGGVILNQGEFVGTVGLNGVGSTHRNSELGYSISENAQGQGIATRACRKVIDIASSETDTHRVMIRAARQNQRSRGIPERLGFTFEGYQHEAAYVQGRFHDFAVYSMLEQNWPANQNNEN